MGFSRQRMLPPDIFTDERLAVLPHAVRLTAIGLRANADNWGRESANPALVKATLWPLTPDVTVDDVFDHLCMLRDVEYLWLYEDGARWIYALVDWPSVSHKTDDRARFPPPPEASGDLPETFSAGEEEREGEEEPAPRYSSGSLPPSRYCPAHRPHGTFGKCGPCGTARERHARWQEEFEAAMRVEEQ